LAVSMAASKAVPTVAMLADAMVAQMVVRTADCSVPLSAACSAVMMVALTVAR